MDWRPMTIGAGAGPLLLVLYMKDLDENVQGTISKFADGPVWVVS